MALPESGPSRSAPREAPSCIRCSVSLSGRPAPGVCTHCLHVLASGLSGNCSHSQPCIHQPRLGTLFIHSFNKHTEPLLCAEHCSKAEEYDHRQNRPSVCAHEACASQGAADNQCISQHTTCPAPRDDAAPLGRGAEAVTSWLVPPRRGF